MMVITDRLAQAVALRAKKRELAEKSESRRTIERNRKALRIQAFLESPIIKREWPS